MDNIIINGKKLDDNQVDVVLNDSNSLLVIAGAGSGKTLTIVSKIHYLIQNHICESKDILCISFTNDAVNSLKEKMLHYNIDIMTFHKLGINILNNNNVQYKLCESNYLEYIVHEFFYGIVFESNYLMRLILKYFKKTCFFDVESKYKLFINNNKKEMKCFEKLISKFIRLFKTNGYDLFYLNLLIKKSFFVCEKIFIIIVLNIYLIYENELYSSGKYDFDDLLIKSTDIILNGGFIKKYKYIIIDEFQDTSYIRYNLINGIVKKTNSKFIAVGDDYQSIYRFTGCDLRIFTDFNKYFLNSKILKLENTYRNSQELIDVCSKFIMKNKKQIKKNLRSSKHLYKPIKVCYVSINDILDGLSGNVMILGRNNDDIYKYTNYNLFFELDRLIYLNNSELNIKYYTVHSSKGLESDNVIVLNVIDDIIGFPNKIEDNKILRFVSSNKKNFDEERRLFYVAVTRTKNFVYLMTEKNRESVFIKEILKYGRDNIEIIKKE